MAGKQTKRQMAGEKAAQPAAPSAWAPPTKVIEPEQEPSEPNELWLRMGLVAGGALSGCVLAGFLLLMFSMAGGLMASNEPGDNSVASRSTKSRRFDSTEIGIIRRKLRAATLGIMNHESATKMFAPQIGDRQELGPQFSQLSWRVHILPYIDQQPLYEQFKLNEPWDSPHNLALVDLMPEAFRIDRSEVGNTRIQVVQGPEMLFGGERPARFREVTDGFSNTVLILAVAPDMAVPWTCPYDFDFDPDNAVASLGNLPSGVFVISTGRGEQFVIGDNISDQDLLAIVTPKGGEVIEPVNIARLTRDTQGLVEPTSFGGQAGPPANRQSPSGSSAD